MEDKREDTHRPGNFQGLRVIDFTHVLAGPYCTKLMADQGAEVIKIEPPTGERARSNPYVKNGASGFYMWRNAGKKCLCLDLKQPRGVEIFKDLVKISDVVVQNRTVGAMDRLGLGYEDLKKVNPQIIMCSISGFGQDGPLAGVGGGDQQIQALSGAMAIGGHADGPPLPSWVPWVDFATGTHALAALGAALFYRKLTGIGQHIDVSMLDCAFSYHDLAVQEYLMSEGRVRRTRTGPMHSSLGLLGVYQCKDDYLLVSATNNLAWQRLTELIGRPELASDPRFDTLAHRAENREEVNLIFAEWIRDFEMSEVKLLLDQAGVSAVPILSIAEAVNHPQIQAREMLVEMDHPQAGRVKLVNSPFKFSETEASVRGRAPLLGEHNDDVLANLLGYGRERIVELWKDKILHAEPGGGTTR